MAQLWTQFHMMIEYDEHKDKKGAWPRKSL